MPGPEPDPEVHVPIDGRVWAVNSFFSAVMVMSWCASILQLTSHAFPCSYFQAGTHSAQGPRGLVDASMGCDRS